MEIRHLLRIALLYSNLRPRLQLRHLSIGSKLISNSPRESNLVQHRSTNSNRSPLKEYPALLKRLHLRLSKRRLPSSTANQVNQNYYQPGRRWCERRWRLRRKLRTSMTEMSDRQGCNRSQRWLVGMMRSPAGPTSPPRSSCYNHCKRKTSRATWKVKGKAPLLWSLATRLMTKTLPRSNRTSKSPP